MRKLHIDLETFSALDIKKVGAFKYAENCEILLCAYAFDNAPVQIIDLAAGNQFPPNLVEAIFNPDILKIAYNAAFEMTVLEKYFGRYIDPSQWDCTMVLGLRLGLPAGLDQLGKVLNLDSDKKKLAVGKRLINYFSKPRPSSAQGAGLFDFDSDNRNTPYSDPDNWKLFKEYCMQDVESERAIYNRLAKYAHPNGEYALWFLDKPASDRLFANISFEHRLWCLDQKINSNGVLIDMNLVEGALAIDAAIKEDALKEGAVLTGGLNLNSNSQMLNWIEQQLGWRPTNLDKTARAELRAESLTPKVTRFLELRDLIGKTSVKKYEAMRDTACDDGRARGMFQFYGANRTGRWAGRLIQLQNLPQNHLDDLDFVRTFIKKKDVDALEFFYDNPSDVLSQAIRTAFVAPTDNRFIVADFSAIEARVIAWLADEKWRMDVFAKGGDIYCASASAMFKVPVEKHGVNKELRAKGKIAELACGYGGGINALKAFGADKMGLSDDEMDIIIKKWRLSSPHICQLWRDVENAVKNVIKSKVPSALKNGLAFHTEDDWLFITLPSGRNISYYKPNITTKDGREYISYEGTLQSSNGWGINYTWGGKLVENIVQAIARDCLAEAMLKLDDAGHKIVMHVHDEVIIEAPNGQGSLDDVVAVMSKPIDWAKGLLLSADGYETCYYRKD